jgi:hypothetical protein
VNDKARRKKLRVVLTDKNKPLINVACSLRVENAADAVLEARDSLGLSPKRRRFGNQVFATR